MNCLEKSVCTQRRWTLTEVRHPNRHCIPSLPALLLCSLPCSREHCGFPGGSDGEDSACKAGDLGSIPRSGGSPREGNGNPFQYSCLLLLDRGSWWATVNGVTELDTAEWLTHRLEITDTVLFSCDLDSFIFFFPNCINSLLNMDKK